MKLATVLKVKIFCTIFFWAAPLLFYSALISEPLGFPAPRPRVWVHLLGASFTALLVGYLLGLREHRRGRDASGTVMVGIISNGLASVILWVFGLGGAWAEWGRGAQIFMWGSAVMTLLITLGLIITRPQSAASSRTD